MISNSRCGMGVNTMTVTETNFRKSAFKSGNVRVIIVEKDDGHELAIENEKGARAAFDGDLFDVLFDLEACCTEAERRLSTWDSEKENE